MMFGLPTSFRSYRDAVALTPPPKARVSVVGAPKTKGMANWECVSRLITLPRAPCALANSSRANPRAAPPRAGNTRADRVAQDDHTDKGASRKEAPSSSRLLGISNPATPNTRCLRKALVPAVARAIAGITRAS